MWAPKSAAANAVHGAGAGAAGPAPAAAAAAGAAAVAAAAAATAAAAAAEGGSWSAMGDDGAVAAAGNGAAGMVWLLALALVLGAFVVVGATGRRDEDGEVEALKRRNPFQTDDVLNTRERMKMAVGVVVAPLRFALVLVVVGLGTVAMMATVVGVDATKPLPPRRGAAQQVISMVTGGLLCACMGLYHVRIEGKRASPEAAKMLVVAPHSTVMDAFVLAYACRGPSSVGKIETKKSFVGPYMRAIQTIFVDRQDKDNRHHVAEEIRTRADMASDWKRQVAIFPEGTCTNRTSLISFRKGAFEPGAPVQPVVLQWSYRNFDPTWCAGAPSRSLIVFRTLSQAYHSVTVKFLPVHVPTTAEKADPVLFCENVRSDMARTLGISCSPHSYSDMFLAQVAAKNKLRPACALDFSFEGLRKELPPSAAKDPALFDRVRALLLVLAKAPGMTKDARLSKAQFDAVAAVAAEELKLSAKDVPVWTSMTAKGDQKDVSFHDFCLAFLQKL